jgi:hypothetical protein
MEVLSFEAGYIEEEVALAGSESESSFHFSAAGAALTSSEGSAARRETTRSRLYPTVSSPVLKGKHACSTNYSTTCCQSNAHNTF